MLVPDFPLDCALTANYFENFLVKMKVKIKMSGPLRKGEVLHWQRRPNPPMVLKKLYKFQIMHGPKIHIEIDDQVFKSGCIRFGGDNLHCQL